MYSPTLRLLSLLELLQSRRQMSGAEIARRLEVDPRTVRRYIVMLQDMGIPIEAERGPLGSYQLMRGYRIPPLMFTEPEATALTLGLLAIRGFRFPVDVAAVESALAKAERVMPEQLLSQARALQETITFYTGLPPNRVQNASVTILSSAAQQRQQVLLRYRSGEGEESERRFDPYGLVFNEGYWYTAGYCHLRRDLRTFRLDRIIALEPLEHTFERPEAFDVLGYVLTSLFSRQGTEQVEVLMKATLEQAQQVVSPDIGMLEEIEHGVIFRRAALHLEWVAFFLMCLDFPVVVIRPQALRETLRQMAASALRITGDSPDG
jgi:predicted DNA-binding transcriptional regulator YafY